MADGGRKVCSVKQMAGELPVRFIMCVAGSDLTDTIISDIMTRFAPQKHTTSKQSTANPRG